MARQLGSEHTAEGAGLRAPSQHSHRSLSLQRPWARGGADQQALGSQGQTWRGGRQTGHQTHGAGTPDSRSTTQHTQWVTPLSVLPQLSPTPTACFLSLWSTKGNEAGDLSGQTDPRRRKWRLELGHPLVLSNIQNFRKRGPRTSSPCRLSALVWGVQYLYFLGTQWLWGCSAPCTDVWSHARTALTPLESTKVMAVAGWGG